MANVSPSRASVPVVAPDNGVAYETAALDSGDALVLDEVPGPRHRVIEVTPSASVTPLGSISDGQYEGQLVTLVGQGLNKLRVPAALSNVSALCDLDVSADIPATLVWNGTSWELSAPRSEKRHAVITYDFAVDGGAIGAIVPDGTTSIPDNAVILDGFCEVETTLTSATDAATVALHVEGADDLVAAIAISDVTNPWDAGLHAIIPTGAVANFIKLTAARQPTVTVAVEALTAGKLHLHLDYVLGA